MTATGGSLGGCRCALPEPSPRWLLWMIICCMRGARHGCRRLSEFKTDSMGTACSPAMSDSEGVDVQVAAAGSSSIDSSGGSSGGGSGPEEPAPEGDDEHAEESRVVFRMEHAVAFGEQVKVVGDGPELGNWDITQAPSEWWSGAHSQSVNSGWHVASRER
jgi:Starch binding domain